MDELRQRLEQAVLNHKGWVAYEGIGNVDAVDAVLAEIGKDHLIVPTKLVDALMNGDYECGDAIDRATYGLDILP